MEEEYQVFLELKLHAKLVHADSDSDVEIAVLQSLLRRFGLDAITANKTQCVIEEIAHDADGAERRIDFWLKVRGTWQALALEVRQPRVFVLHERKWP